MPRILILEDSPMDQRVLRSALDRLYEIKCVSSVEEFKRVSSSFRPDLVLLDVVLPEGSGFEAYHELQRDPRLAQVPVFFVSGRASPLDKVAGLSLGADDYITKPFDAEELKARVANRLRKQATGARSQNGLIEAGCLKIDTNAQTVHVQEGDRLVFVNLTPTELRLLVFFVNNEGMPLSRRIIVDKLWGQQNVHVTERSVDTQIKGLRQKCLSCEHYFVTVYGEGYRFDTAATPAPKLKQSA